MPKAVSPIKVLEQGSASAKARFFYAGVFALQREREWLKKQKPPKSPLDKKPIKR